MPELLRVLVTGGSGFIGSHVAEGLIAEGYDVRVFDALPYPYPVPRGRFEAVVGNLTAAEEVQEAVKDCDGIVHLAGASRVRAGYENPLRCIVNNVMGTASVLEASRLSASKPWIVLGSTREISQSAGASLGYPNLYVLTKFCAEECARRYAEDYGLRVLALRFSDVYGSERDHSTKILPLFVQKALAGSPLPVEEPLARFDFTYYADLIRGVLQGVAWLKGRGCGVYESVTLCTGEAVTLPQLAETIVSELQSSSRIEIQPRNQCGKDLSSIGNDPKPARELFGFNTVTSLADGVRLMVANQPKES